MSLGFIDKFLNSITMYRLVMYGLLFLAAVSIVFGFLSMLAYDGFNFLATLVLILCACYVSNLFFAKLFHAVVNSESWVITACILFFILVPIVNATDLWVTLVAAVVAMASKYIFTVGRKLIFNPAAIAVFLLGLFGFGNAIWWVGSSILLPFVFVFGLLVVRKIRRFSMVFAFIIFALTTIVFFNIGHDISVVQSLSQVIFSWPLIFFATIMLTEPQTTPPHRKLQIFYGGFVGILFGLQFQIGPLYASPEFALIVGNIFSYLVSPKQKLFLYLQEKIELSPLIFEFIFKKPQNFIFVPGQYMEWTLPLAKTDIRGNRRYFTIASSPTEDTIKLGVKIAGNNPSVFKQALRNMKKDSLIIAGNLAGDFVLPKDLQKKLVFIAGGIGITPFKSMIQYMLDSQEKRDVVLFHVCSKEEEFVYKNLCDQAEKSLGVKIVHVLSDKTAQWTGESGRITEDMIRKHVPDYQSRLFYLSGPNVMVNGYKKLIHNLGIKNAQIMTDYFPGF